MVSIRWISSRCSELVCLELTSWVDNPAAFSLEKRANQMGDQANPHGTRWLQEWQKSSHIKWFFCSASICIGIFGSVGFWKVDIKRIQPFILGPISDMDACGTGFGNGKFGNQQCSSSLDCQFLQHIHQGLTDLYGRIVEFPHDLVDNYWPETGQFNAQEQWRLGWGLELWENDWGIGIGCLECHQR